MAGKMRVNPEWMKRLIESMEQAKEIDETISFNASAKWLALELGIRRIPFKVINLGVGVRRITTNINICPKCHGTGFVR